MSNVAKRPRVPKVSSGSGTQATKKGVVWSGNAAKARPRKKGTEPKPADRPTRASKKIMVQVSKKPTALLAARPLPYRMMFRSSPGKRADVVKAGVAASVVKILASDLRYEQGALIDVLGFSRATVSRKIKAGQRLDLSASERVLGAMRLVGQVKHMVEESGDPKGFDASKWVGWWLDQPLPALGGRAPAEFMDSGPGQELVSQLLAQTQSGAYA